jgi:hypothetical protein
MIKMVHELCTEGSYMKTIKSINDKSTSNIILNEEKIWKDFPLDLEKGKGAHFTTLIQYITRILAKAIRQKEEIKGIWRGKEEVKLSLPADMILQKKKIWLYQLIF